MTRKEFLKTMEKLLEMLGPKATKKTYDDIICYRFKKLGFDVFENNTFNLRENKIVVFLNIENIERFSFGVSYTKSYKTKKINVYFRFKDEKRGINIVGLRS